MTTPQLPEVTTGPHLCAVETMYTKRKGEVLLGRAYNGCGVWFWPGYGVTCSCHVTTNGNLRTLMRSWGAPTSLTPEGFAFFVGRAFYAAARLALRENAL